MINKPHRWDLLVVNFFESPMPVGGNILYSSFCCCPWLLWFNIHPLSLLVPKWLHKLLVQAHHFTVEETEAQRGGGHAAGRAWGQVLAPLPASVPSPPPCAPGRNALSEQGWETDVISPRNGELGGKGQQRRVAWRQALLLVLHHHMAPALTSNPFKWRYFQQMGGK